MKFRILGAAVVLALAAMPSKARQPQPIPAPQPAISTYCATIEPGNPFSKVYDYQAWSAWRAKGDWDSRGDNACARNLFIRRQGPRLLGRSHTQTRAGSSYPRPVRGTEANAFRSVRHKFGLSIHRLPETDGLRSKNVTRGRRPRVTRMSPLEKATVVLGHALGVRRGSTISEHIKARDRSPRSEILGLPQKNLLLIKNQSQFLAIPLPD